MLIKGTASVSSFFCDKTGGVCMVKVNGEMMDVNGRTVTELLESMDYGSQRVAVEINEVIIPRASYGETIVKDGDTVEVVRFVGGG